MTVRANKPAFNVREKLKELERPIGIAGNQILKSDSAQNVRSYLGAGRKNLVINGAMRFNQRYGSASTVPTDQYVLDRFKFKENHGGSASINRDEFPIGDNHPDGHRYAMQVACAATDTSLSGTEHSVIMHMIEGFNCIGTGFGTGEAKNVTISFWVKTNCQGTYTVALKNSAQNKCMVKEYTAGEYGFNWQKIVLTFPGCTDGSWLYDENIGMKLEFALAAGTSYTTSDFGIWKSSNVFLSPNQVNFFQNTNNRFFITGVQLEIGDEATDFEHLSYPDELALCQRYYEKSFQIDTEPAHGSDTSSFSTTSGVCEGPAHHRAYMPGNTYHRRNTFLRFQVRKRTEPSVALYGNSNARPWGYGGTGWFTGSWGSSSSENGFEWVNEAVASSTLHVQSHWTADAEF